MNTRNPVAGDLIVATLLNLEHEYVVVELPKEPGVALCDRNPRPALVVGKVQDAVETAIVEFPRAKFAVSVVQFGLDGRQKSIGEVFATTICLVTTVTVTDVEGVCESGALVFEGIEPVLSRRGHVKTSPRVENLSERQGREASSVVDAGNDVVPYR